jgi:hypothetical protein
MKGTVRGKSEKTPNQTNQKMQCKDVALSVIKNKLVFLTDLIVL